MLSLYLVIENIGKGFYCFHFCACLCVFMCVVLDSLVFSTSTHSKLTSPRKDKIKHGLKANEQKMHSETINTGFALNQ